MAVRKFEGFSELAAKLKELPVKVEKKVIRTALRSGTKIIADATKANAPVLTGTMKRAITVRAMKRSRNRIGFMVTFNKRYTDKLVRMSKTRTTKKGTPVRYFYPAAIEYGTKHAPAHPFMRPAFDSKVSEATRVIGDELGKGIVEAART
jgi:HK97 gp10 family phage protein